MELDESLRRRKKPQESEDGWIRGLRGQEQDMSSYYIPYALTVYFPYA